MENRGDSCQGDLAADESHTLSGSNVESCVAQDINNMELPNRDAESDVDCTKPTEDENHKETAPHNEYRRDEQELNSAQKSKEREDRPLVLEERHSLSIAETKRRRARVHSNEHLFIPKELARSQLHRRSYCSSANTLDGISRNSDYCIRMLKFPVGSCRARSVAQQMKRKNARKSQELQLEEVKEAKNEMGCITNEQNGKSPLECNAASQQVDDILSSSMPIVETENPHQNRLENDNECFITLEDTADEASSETETEEDGTEELIERLSKSQLKRDARLQLQHLKDNQQQEQRYQCFRWHNPSCSDKETKMGVLKDLERMSSSSNCETEVNFNMLATADNEEHQQQPQQVAESYELSDESAIELQEFLPDVRETTQGEEQLQLQEHISNELSDEPENNLDKFLPDRVATQQQEDEQQQQHDNSIEAVSIPRSEHLQQQHQLIADVPPTAINNYHTLEEQPADLTIRSLLMKRLRLQPSTSDVLQSHSANNTAGNNVLNENLQQLFVEPSDLMQQWRMQQYERQHQLSLAMQQQQQVSMREQQHHAIYQEHQWDGDKEELQKLKAQYDTLKCKEVQQLQSFSNSLRELYANRQLRKRRHDDYHKTFLQKMDESKNQEESLYVQKHKLTLQIQADLSSLHQRITDKHRQLQERTWQWQRQQQLLHQHHQQQELVFRQHQQHQHQQQLHQHFLRHMQPPSYQPRLQCFQDAIAQCQIPSSVQGRPPLMLPPQTPQPSVYHPDSIQPPVAQNFNECIMQHQQPIDYRTHNTYPYSYPTHRPFQQSRANVAINPSRGYYDQSTVRSDTPHFTLPELPIASGTTQVNRAIEQTANASIISNYATNFLNDTESTNR